MRTPHSLRSRRWPLCAALVTALAAAPAFSATFNGSNAGAIPDGNLAGREIGFAVSGLQRGVRRVSLSVTMAHPWAADLTLTLVSPDGRARLVLLGRPGLNRGAPSGNTVNFDGTYTFSDSAVGDLWATIAGQAEDFVVPPGSYRTTTAGRSGLSDIGGCSTHLNRAFAGLGGSALNGQWTLHVVDSANGDLGTVSAATLTIETGPSLFSGGFEDGEPAASPPPPASATRGRCLVTLFDYTGTGLSSYATVRNTGGGPNGAVTWTVRENDGTATGAVQEFEFGKASDTFLDGDFDGDGIRDATVWRSGTKGHYLVRRSSRPDDVPLRITLGTTGDNPDIAGDYDGDNVTDGALYRAGASAGLASTVEIRLSSDGSVRSFEAGENGDFPIGGLDYDADGAADVAIQSNAGGGNASFEVFNGGSGAAGETFLFGKPTDVIVPGTHAGTPRADVTVIRGVGGQLEWHVRDSQTGLAQPVVTFGASATDFVLTGDYDGDGIYDPAVWRPGPLPAGGTFFVRRSSAPDTSFEVPGGANSDYPPANGRNN
ncbi:hypothetical protein [Chiayiivirga flava]|uniref:Subtilisin-like proprotein convertase family protein n=1 Tax=Chiayiivirga flava TaxID=659595 RepID=A0A7W8D4E2_9GAMM|nr:hypothetical protein [Chiayiivirga flava]MBB5206492.1 subtilisin-like proprotein convertase family protein [Chiayiivirga flava]